MYSTDKIKALINTEVRSATNLFQVNTEYKHTAAKGSLLTLHISQPVQNPEAQNILASRHRGPGFGPRGMSMLFGLDFSND